MLPMSCEVHLPEWCTFASSSQAPVTLASLKRRLASVSCPPNISLKCPPHTSLTWQDNECTMHPQTSLGPLVGVAAIVFGDLLKPGAMVYTDGNIFQARGLCLSEDRHPLALATNSTKDI